MKVMLSIKPVFAHMIFDGTKKYEFRRTIFKHPGVRKVIVYASSPVKKVIGEFDIECILMDDLQTLWEKTSHSAGIPEDYFFEYFADKQRGYAIKIKNTFLYKLPKCIRRDFNLIPPQSFSYVA
jgi:predicted transcriptional regulator